MYWPIDENVVTTGPEKPNPLFSLGAMVQYSQIQGSQGLHTTELL